MEIFCKGMLKMKDKYVYIFGDENLGMFHGYTHDKNIAKAIKDKRKHLTCYKIKDDEKFNARVSLNDEFVTYDDTILTCNEEIYFIESFGQFQQDSARWIQLLSKNIKYFNWNEEELPFINYLMEYLTSYSEFILHGQYQDEYCDFDINELYDINKAIKWFVENILDGSGDR